MKNNETCTGFLIAEKWVSQFGRQEFKDTHFFSIKKFL